jgi:hypothetical protein
MGCLCRQKKKKDLVYVRSQAIRASNLNQIDYQIYTLVLYPIGQIYDFEPINDSRTTVVEYVRFEDL